MSLPISTKPHSTAPFPTIAALLMAAGVACGAFGAHALKDLVSPTDLAIWEKAVLYHLIHASAILVVAALPGLSYGSRRRISLILTISILIFSGTLYALVLSNQRWLGAITPIGGSGFILAWILLSLELMQTSRRDREVSGKEEVHSSPSRS